MGIRKPVHLLQRGRDVRDIVNVAAIAVVDARRARGELLAEETTTAEHPLAREAEPVPVA